MQHELAEIYADDKTFIDFFADDLNDGKVWYNLSEFGRVYEINGTCLLCCFVASKSFATANFGTPENRDSFGVNNAEGVIYFRAQDVSGVKVDQVITINGKEYLVTKADLLQDQVWRLELGRVQE